MTALSRPGFSALSDGDPPDVPSAKPCAICGWHALGTDPETAPAGATSTSSRLVCHVCGAHHVAES